MRSRDLAAKLRQELKSGKSLSQAVNAIVGSPKGTIKQLIEPQGNNVEQNIKGEIK